MTGARVVAKVHRLRRPGSLIVADSMADYTVDTMNRAPRTLAAPSPTEAVG